MPDIVHSDQDHNFESALLKQSLEVFGISKTHMKAYHPEGDGMVERPITSTTPYIRILKVSLIGRSITHLHCMLTALLHRYITHIS